MNLQEWELLAAAASAHQLAESREERQVSRIDEIKSVIRRYERELVQLERFGDGARFVDGDVIKFTRTYGDEVRSPGTYTYAAIKTPRGWYVTGAMFKKNPYTYDELIELITRSPCSTDVQVAAGWVSIDEAWVSIDEAGKRVSPQVIGDPMAGFVSPTVSAEKRDYEIK